MSQIVCILPNPADRLQLEVIEPNRNRPLKHVHDAECNPAKRLDIARDCEGRAQVKART
jgi:hypothetical protein